MACAPYHTHSRHMIICRHNIFLRLQEPEDFLAFFWLLIFLDYAIYKGAMNVKYLFPLLWWIMQGQGVIAGSQSHNVSSVSDIKYMIWSTELLKYEQCKYVIYLYNLQHCVVYVALILSYQDHPVK